MTNKFAKVVEAPDGEQVVLMRNYCDCGCGCATVHAAMRLDNRMFMRVIDRPMLEGFDHENCTREEYVAQMDKEFDEFGPAEAFAMLAKAQSDFELTGSTLN